MRWFGPSWGAPVNEYGEQVPVPVGARCLSCGELVGEGDQGVQVPYVPVSGVPRLEAWHRLCFLESVVGPTTAASLPEGVGSGG